MSTRFFSGCCLFCRHAPCASFTDPRLKSVIIIFVLQIIRGPPFLFGSLLTLCALVFASLIPDNSVRFNTAHSSSRLTLVVVINVYSGESVEETWSRFISV